ncbi:MAG: type II secretion system protein GspD [Nitrospiraceae bacterium]|nr:MAG: type II secretion system protein GspD [Nitrospiraceae bacterium]
MKKYLIQLLVICMVLAGTYAFAQDTSVPPKPAENIVTDQQRPQPQAVPSQPQPPPPVPPVNVPPQVPVPPQQPANIQQGIPPVLPPGITPEQARAFLQRPKEENYIILNFDNADLRDVINTVGTITKENFIISPGVDARITIHSAKKIPVSEVMNVFESVLEANGITLVRSGEFFKVIPGATAKQKPLEIRKGSEAGSIPDVDRIVTQIVSVNYVPVTEITTVLTPLLSQFGSIIPNLRNNLLIVNDLSSNIKRLLTILEEIDVNVFQNTRMFFFKPTYSDVATLTEELTEVLNAMNITKEGISLMPIERINSLVVFSASPSLLQAVEGWLKKLDEEVVSGQNVFIYHVQNVKAETIADILNSLYGEGGTAKKVSARTAQIDPAKRAPAQQQAQPIHPAGTQGGTGGKIEIITFEPTNSLIILAPAGIYREMVETIKKIDTYPREVLIEAIVAQVTLADTDKFGIQWSVLDELHRNGTFTELFRMTSGQSEAASLLTTAPLLSTAPANATGLAYVLFRPDKLAALVHALASRGKVNILSSPRLLVRDQEEANIEVGSEIPTATSTTTSTEGTTSTQSIQYKTVGIKLKIKPIINEEKTVVLDLEQEVSSKGEDQTVGGLSYPSFNATKAKTSIVVPDKQGIVIGGIMEETKDKGYQGVPLLSSIPIFGNLFRYNIDKTTKKELVIIITPYVVVNKTEGEKLSGDFMDKLREVKKYLNEKDVEYKQPAPSAQNK